MSTKFGLFFVLFLAAIFGSACSTPVMDPIDLDNEAIRVVGRVDDVEVDVVIAADRLEEDPIGTLPPFNAPVWEADAAVYPMEEEATEAAEAETTETEPEAETTETEPEAANDGETEEVYPLVTFTNGADHAITYTMHLTGYIKFNRGIGDQPDWLYDQVEDKLNTTGEIHGDGDFATILDGVIIENADGETFGIEFVITAGEHTFNITHPDGNPGFALWPVMPAEDCVPFITFVQGDNVFTAMVDHYIQATKVDFGPEWLYLQQEMTIVVTCEAIWMDGDSKVTFDGVVIEADGKTFGIDFLVVPGTHTLLIEHQTQPTFALWPIEP